MSPLDVLFRIPPAVGPGPKVHFFTATEGWIGSYDYAGTNLYRVVWIPRFGGLVLAHRSTSAEMTRFDRGGGAWAGFSRLMSCT